MMRTSLFIVAVLHNMIDMHRHHEVPKYYERKSPVHLQKAAPPNVMLRWGMITIRSSRPETLIKFLGPIYLSVTLMTGG